MGKKLFGDFVLKFIILLFLLFLFHSVSYAGEIHNAAKAGDVLRLKEMLDNEPGIIDSEYDKDDYRGFTPLMFAVLNGKIKAADYLIDRGAKVNTPQCIPPLHLAIFKGDGKMAALLIKRGVDVNLEFSSNPRNYLNETDIPKQFELIEYKNSGYYPLMSESINNHLTIANLLLAEFFNKIPPKKLPTSFKAALWKDFIAMAFAIL